jgi:hypothetical protein
MVNLYHISMIHPKLTKQQYKAQLNSSNSEQRKQAIHTCPKEPPYPPPQPEKQVLFQRSLSSHFQSLLMQQAHPSGSFE